MEDLQDKLIKAIDEDVRSNADLVDDMLNKEKKVLLDDQINFFKEGLEKDKSAYLEGELKELRSYAAMKSSRDKLDVKKKLIELRSHYADQLFAEVREKVLAFSHSAEYRNYLEKALSTQKISQNGYFEVRKEDVELMQSVLKKAGLSNEVRTVYMPLGGFHYVDEENRFEYSCSLDEKCDEAFEWFTSHSSFQIVESEEDHA